MQIVGYYAMNHCSLISPGRFLSTTSSTCNEILFDVLKLEDRVKRLQTFNGTAFYGDRAEARIALDDAIEGKF